MWWTIYDHEPHFCNLKDKAYLLTHVMAEMNKHS